MGAYQRDLFDRILLEKLPELILSKRWQVLIWGLEGSNVEACKNLVLAGGQKGYFASLLFALVIRCSGMVVW